MVRRLLVDGHTAATIQEAALAGELEFDAATPTLEEFLAALQAARTDFEDAADESSASLVGWTLETSRQLYASMVEVGDFAGALRAVDQIRKGAETKEKLNL